MGEQVAARIKVKEKPSPFSPSPGRHPAFSMQDRRSLGLSRSKIVTNGGVAQLGEHLPCKQGVMSSNLTISTKALRSAKREIYGCVVFTRKQTKIYRLKGRKPVMKKTGGL